MKRISNKAKLKHVLGIFYEHYICPDCKAKAAFHLLDCENPLHEIHEELYRLWDRSNQ